MAAAEMVDDKDLRDDGRARAPRAVVGSHRQEEEMFGRAFDGHILGRIWHFIRPYRRQMAVAIAAVLVFTGTQVAIPLIIRFAIDQGMATGNGRVLTLSVMPAHAGTGSGYAPPEPDFKIKGNNGLGNGVDGPPPGIAKQGLPQNDETPVQPGQPDYKGGGPK